MAADDPIGQLDDHDWRALDLPAGLLPAAMAAFRTPEQGQQWIELLNRVASKPSRVRIMPDQFPYWRTEEYLRAIAEAGLELTVYQQWLDAGLGVVDLPQQSTRMMQAGIFPAELKRCRAAGLSGKYLPQLLEYLDFETAIQVLDKWNGPRKSAARQLVSLVKTYGWTVDQLTAVMATGLGGCDIYEWRKSKIPSAEWVSWVSLRIGPAVANIYRNRGVSPQSAELWEKSRLSIRDVLAALDLGLPLDKAVELVESNVCLDDVERAGDSWVYEVPEPEPEPEPGPWDDDPVGQLPDVIKPGRYHLTLWVSGYDNDHVAHDFWFTWDGEREAQWSEDIRFDYRVDSFMGYEAPPTRGTAAWPNGRDVEVTYSSEDLCIEGEELLSGVAPTSDNPTSDEGMRDPKQWVRLAEELFGVVLYAMED